ncbi:hypothetical protein Tco_1168236 [Tanacetum coccineum]
MAVRVPHAMSSSLSVDMVEVAAMSESAFRKRFRSSYESFPSVSPPDLPSRKRYRGTSELVEDSEEEDYEVEGPGMDDRGHSVESDGLGLEEEEDVPRGQQQAAPVIGTTTDPEDGMICIDIPDYPPPAPPVQTPPLPATPAAVETEGFLTELGAQVGAVKEEIFSQRPVLALEAWAELAEVVDSIRRGRTEPRGVESEFYPCVNVALCLLLSVVRADTPHFIRWKRIRRGMVAEKYGTVIGDSCRKPDHTFDCILEQPLAEPRDAQISDLVITRQHVDKKGLIRGFAISGALLKSYDGIVESVEYCQKKVSTARRKVSTASTNLILLEDLVLSKKINTAKGSQRCSWTEGKAAGQHTHDLGLIKVAVADCL